MICLYSGFITMKPKLSSSQHQWQDNVIKAQKYIYNENDTMYDVIIGSSLSCRLRMDSLQGFYNLSFGGQSIFDGLKILEKSENLPRNVYIETNVLLRGESKSFTNSLFSPFQYYTGKYFLSLRADKQPIPISIGYFMAFKRVLKNKIEKLSNKIDNPKSNIQRDDLSNKMLNLQIKSYSIQPDSTLLNNRLMELMSYIEFLKQNNVNIYFFEMPVNYKLIELPKTKTIRAKLYEIFPKYEYNYIKTDSSKYITGDGVHLTNDEALKYTFFFKQQFSE